MRRCALPLLAVASLVGCSVADNLSGPEILQEIDGIVRVSGRGSERTLEYASEADVSAWYARFWLFQPVRPLFTIPFGSTSREILPNPAQHVRDLLCELPDEVGSDLELAALSCTRLGWITLLESNGYDRLLALDAMAAVLLQLEVDVFPAQLEDLTLSSEPASVARAEAAFEMGRPRSARERTMGPERGAYLAALTTLVERPLPAGWRRLELTESLTDAWRLESDGALREATRQALLRSLGHVFVGSLLRALDGRSLETLELRLCAMEHVRRFAGARGTNLLLAYMAATPEQVRANEPRYDPDPLVRLRLAHYCGQLRGDLADFALRLPNREAWEAVSPREFLATLILQEDQLYSKLRLPALVALTWSLGRPRLDPDTNWVQQWVDGRLR